MTNPQALNNAPSEAARRTLFGRATEQVTEVQATVTGTLPAWLDGSLLVNGGGDYSAMRHMFDGYALVVKVRVAGGAAWGSQRYLATHAYEAYQATGACSGDDGVWIFRREHVFVQTGGMSQNERGT